jgi:hypothetical protein
MIYRFFVQEETYLILFYLLPYSVSSNLWRVDAKNQICRVPKIMYRKIMITHIKSKQKFPKNYGILNLYRYASKQKGYQQIVQNIFLDKWGRWVPPLFLGVPVMSPNTGNKNYYIFSLFRINIDLLLIHISDCFSLRIQVLMTKIILQLNHFFCYFLGKNCNLLIHKPTQLTHKLQESLQL